MGDPRKKRKKYETPKHPWQASRIKSEKEVLREYTLKNKKEIWKMQSILRKFTSQAKKLSYITTEQVKKEKEQLIKKLCKLGLIKPTAKPEDVLNLTLKDILERRLQTILFKQNLARTMKQARQFITHHHILINNKLITSPSYLVPLEEENKISFRGGSPLFKEEHTERIKIEKKPKTKRKKVKKKIIKVIKKKEK